MKNNENTNMTQAEKNTAIANRANDEFRAWVLRYLHNTPNGIEVKPANDPAWDDENKE